MMYADEQRWEAALAEQGSSPTPEIAKVCRYRSAQRRARAMGVLFQPMETLAKTANIGELVKRVKLVTSPDAPEAVAEPRVTVRLALALYFYKLVVDDLRTKSPEQAAKLLIERCRQDYNIPAHMGLTSPERSG